MVSKTFLLIINPAAGKQGFLHKSEFIISQFKNRKLPYFIYHTQKDSPILHLSLFLRDHEEITDIIILGGDGTINLVLNSIPHFEYTLAIIGNGTGNDSIKSIQQKSTFHEQVKAALSDRYKLIDIGVCNDQYFLNGVGIGFDGLVVDHLQKSKKKRKGLWAYLIVVLQLLPFPKWWWMNIEFENTSQKKKVFSLTAANGTTFGGGFVMNPKAKTDDGLLDICIFTKPPLLEKCLVLPFVMFGKHGFSQRVNYYKSKTLNVSSDLPIKAHIDGEKLESKTFNIHIKKDGLKVKY